MNRRILAALTVVVALSAQLLVTGSPATAATSPLPGTVAVSLTGSVVHYLPGKSYSPTLTGSFTLDSTAACGAGDCHVQVAIYPPGSSAAWSVTDLYGPAGMTWDPLSVTFPFPPVVEPPAGDHSVVMRVLSASDAELGSSVVAHLTVYLPKARPSLAFRDKSLLEGRLVRGMMALRWGYADGFMRPYGGPELTANLQRKVGTGPFKTVLHRTLSSAGHYSKLRWTATRTATWRVVTTDGLTSQRSEPVVIRVAQQLNNFRIVKAGFYPSWVYATRSIQLYASVKAEYSNGVWAVPLPGLSVEAQFRDVGATSWKTVERGKVRNGDVLTLVSPKRDGYWRMRLADKTSKAQYVDVRPPILEQVYVLWPASFHRGDRVVFPAIASDTIDQYMSGVSLVLQYRRDDTVGWTTLDSGSTNDNGKVSLIENNGRGGIYRVYAPKSDIGNEKYYSR